MNNIGVKLSWPMHASGPSNQVCSGHFINSKPQQNTLVWMAMENMLFRIQNLNSKRTLILSTQNESGLDVTFKNVLDQEGNVKIDISCVNDYEGDSHFTKKILGCLGCVRKEGEDYLVVIENAKSIGSLFGKGIYQLTSVLFFSVSGKAPDLYNLDRTDIDFNTDESFFDDSSIRPRSSSVQLNEHPCIDLARYLTQGTFYFGNDFDITQSMQSSILSKNESLMDLNVNSFLWNSHMLNPISKFLKMQEASLQKLLIEKKIFTYLIQGFIGIAEKNLMNQNVKLAILSRVSFKRPGTRYYSRGIDDDGYVSNFVETEVVFESTEVRMSYIIIRGSVPVFWEQQGSSGKVQQTRTSIATQPAFERHVSRLKETYGLVHAVNLLGSNQNEQLLTTAYSFNACRLLNLDDSFTFSTFDINSDFSYIPNQRLEELFCRISYEVPVFSYLVQDKSGKSVRKQKGVFRINCLDCLDRSNVVQAFIITKIADLFIRNYVAGRSNLKLHDIKVEIDHLMADNGDQLSMIFTGAGALKSNFTRNGEMSVRGLMADVSKSARRIYSNYVLDDCKNEVIKIILGSSSNTEHVLLPEIMQISSAPHFGIEHISVENVIVKCITWNINGMLPKAEDLSCLVKSTNQAIPDIVAIGFQEIVELNASQMISADQERKIIWETRILDLLNTVVSQNEYGLLVSNQLVGTTISIFCRCTLFPIIRNVEVGKKMTGLGGMTGNKGSVAAWLDIENTTYSFVSSHLAAGQNNINDRNNDWKSAFFDLTSSSGRRLQSRDYIFWMGDLNYRLNCPRDRALLAINSGKSSNLLKHDQLSREIKVGAVFPGFKEMLITFPPTYKFDPGTNIYDTSEKARIPSWTDRILYRGSCKIISLEYIRCELDISDHKPVSATFQVKQLEKYADGRICADHEPVSDDLDSSSCSEDLSDAEKSDLVSIEGSTFPFSQICIEELQNYSVPLSRYLMKLGF